MNTGTVTTESSREKRNRKMPADVWIPSAIRIFRENGCRFEWVESVPFCVFGKRKIKINNSVVNTLIDLDHYLELRRYFEGLCDKAKRKGKK